MRVIVDEIVRDALADSFQQHGRHITFGPASLAGEMAVLDEVSAGCEGPAVAAGE